MVVGVGTRIFEHGDGSITIVVHRNGVVRALAVGQPPVEAPPTVPPRIHVVVLDDGNVAIVEKFVTDGSIKIVEKHSIMVAPEEPPSPPWHWMEHMVFSF